MWPVWLRQRGAAEKYVPMALSVEREPRVTNNQTKLCNVSADESERTWTRKCEHCPGGWIHL